MQTSRRLKLILLLCCGLITFGAASFRPFRLDALAVEQASYVGNQACAKCHQEIARGYAQTPMATSSGAVGDDVVEGEFRHNPSGVRYRIVRENGAAWLEYERRDGARAGDWLQGRRQLQYFIGSNAAGRSFLSIIDRFLFQAPVTWYAQSRRWDVSPGYETDREMRFSRPIEANCLYCHASQSQPVFDTQNRYVDPPFTQPGVGCERCHGPGSLHARGLGAMINPAKLDAARRDSVCAQCHLSGEARVERAGKRLAFYRPGDLLSDYVSYFVFDESQKTGLKANSHVENLGQSACKQRSGESMSCLNCHDPHFAPAPRDRADYFRGKCLECHRTEGLPANERHTLKSDCAGCHMPKSRAVDGGHGVLTDHRIRRVPSAPGAEALAGRKLVSFPGFASDARMLGLAYAEVALRSNDPFHQREAWLLLREALPRHATEPELLTRLAFIHEARNETEQALRLYEAALRAEPRRAQQFVIAAVNAGRIYAARGEMGRAIALWQDALTRNPALSEAAFNLALALQSQGDRKRAGEALMQLLRFEPDSARTKDLLRQIRVAEKQTGRE
jgi:tetratricopeptide (TPR) repeat protein